MKCKKRKYVVERKPKLHPYCFYQKYLFTYFHFLSFFCCSRLKVIVVFFHAALSIRLLSPFIFILLVVVITIIILVWHLLLQLYHTLGITERTTAYFPGEWHPLLCHKPPPPPPSLRLSRYISDG